MLYALSEALHLSHTLAQSTHPILSPSHALLLAVLALLGYCYWRRRKSRQGKGMPTMGDNPSSKFAGRSASTHMQVIRLVGAIACGGNHECAAYIVAGMH